MTIQERTERVNAMTTEILEEDYQGADAEQHLLAAEGLMVIVGKTASLLGDQGIDVNNVETYSHLLKLAELHIRVAEARRG